jgi:hypothetical protein
MPFGVRPRSPVLLQRLLHRWLTLGVATCVEHVLPRLPFQYAQTVELVDLWFTGDRLLVYLVNRRAGRKPDGVSIPDHVFVAASPLAERLSFDHMRTVVPAWERPSDP